MVRSREAIAGELPLAMRHAHAPGGSCSGAQPGYCWLPIWRQARCGRRTSPLSANGSSSHRKADDYTEFGPNGSSTNVKYVYHRTAGTSGFAGTWVSSSETLNSVYVIEIRPYEGDGLSFINSSQGVTRNVTFDGKDHPLVGPHALSGTTSSARRVNERTLEITTKISDKVAGTQEETLSSDGKTLTMTVRAAGRTAPNILLF